MLLYLGFKKSQDTPHSKNLVNHLWEVLSLKFKAAVSSQGLFNFLCYIQHYEGMIDRSFDFTIELHHNLKFNDYGYTLDGIFFLSDKNTLDIQEKLIGDFYPLVSNKKSFDRKSTILSHHQKTLREMSTEETHKPKLAPKTSRDYQRSSTRKAYFEVLAQRSPVKLEKIQK